MIRVLPVRVRASVWLNLAIGLSMLTACQATRTPLMSPSDETSGEISHGRELTFTPTATPALVQAIPSVSATPSQTKTPTISASTPSFTPTSPSKPTPTPTATAVWATLTPALLHRLPAQTQRATWLVPDETHLYFVLGSDDRRHIFRYPFAGGPIEMVATTNFDDGDIATYKPIRSGDWLIFVDTHEDDYAAWIVRALNLRDGNERVVVEEAGDADSWPGPDIEADGDWVVWTQLKQSKQAACTETILALRNLRTGEQRELDRICAETNYMWVAPALSGGKLVVEQDLPDNRGRGNNIYLFDLDTGQRVALTTDGKSSMPAFSYPWAIWKAGPRYSQGFEAVVYDLRDGRREVIAAPGGESGDPRLDGQWLYWIASRRRPLYIYDLVNKRMFLALTPPPGEKAAVLGAVIYGNRIVWGYTSDSSVVDPEIVLEWRTLP